MYSILAAKSRVPSNLLKTGIVADLKLISWKSFLPNHDDVQSVKHNLIVFICRLLTKFFCDLSPFSKIMCTHTYTILILTRGGK